jgi:lysophospholipase L1-like esterase
MAADYTVTTPSANTVRMVEDHEGMLRRVNVGELRFRGVRRVENLNPETDLDYWGKQQTNTGTVIANGDGSMTLNSPAAGDRSYIFKTITVEAGVTYLISAQFTNVVGPANWATAISSVGVTPTYIGPGSRELQSTDDQRFGIAMVFATGGSTQIRIGCGVLTGVDDTSSCVLSKVQIEETEKQLPSAYVDPAEDHGVSDDPVLGVKNFNTVNNSLWNTTTGVVTIVDGPSIDSRFSSFHACGDSLANDSGDWPGDVSASALRTTYAVGGARLVSAIETQVDTAIAAGRVNTIILNGGINDIIAGTSAADIQAAAERIVTAIRSAGLDAVILGVTPWKNHASWTAGKQTVTDTYNAWLADSARTLGFTYVDVYTPLEDATADELEGTYDNGDGLHPNTAGFEAMGAAVDAVLTPLQGGLKGYFAEPASENLVPEPLDTSDVVWVANNVTKISTPIMAPDGRLTAYGAIEGTGSNSYWLADTTAAHTAGATITASAYVKRGVGTRHAGLKVAWTGAEARLTYNLDTLANIEATTTGTGTVYKYGIEAVGNDWFRMWITTDEGGSDTTANIQLHFSDGTATNGNYNGDSTSELYWWGIQLEESVNVSSLIPFNGPRADDSNLEFHINNLPATEGSYEHEIILPFSSAGGFTGTYTIARGGHGNSTLSRYTTGLSRPSSISPSGSATPGSISFDAGAEIRQRTRWSADNSVMNTAHSHGITQADDSTPDSSFTTWTLGSSLEILQTPKEHDESGPIGVSIKNIKIWNVDRGDSWLNEVVE